MTPMPMENPAQSNQVYFPPIMDATNPNVGPMSRGASFKSIMNVKLINDAGELKSDNPLLIYSLPSGPAGKLTVFMRRSSGTGDGAVSIYGSFKEKPEVNEKVMLVENLTWTDTITEIISEISNPFPVLLVEYTFLGNENTTVDLNFSSF